VVSAVVAVVLGTIIFPILVMAADFERNRGDASLRLTIQKGLQGKPRALTILPFLHTEIAEFIFATTPTKILVIFVS
jgi:hypothetical protein